MTVLAPAISGLDSLVGICLITMIAQVFWFFGLHGASITQPIRLPFMQMYLIANLSAFSAGQPSYITLLNHSGHMLLHLVVVELQWDFVSCC
jgi:cellobiose-specific phosphotransferase system component IIC